MSFNSTEFILFVLLTLLLYFVIPGKIRYIYLLLVSLIFYSLWSIPSTVLLIASSLCTYYLGMLCEAGHEKNAREKAADRRKRILAAGILLLVAELFIFKYLNFTLQQINRVMSIGRTALQFRPLSLVMPVGVSFYVFQSIAYLVDVYRGRSKAEKNVARFLLFITFFPKIIQGPIERSDNFLKQIHEIEERSCFDYSRVANGLITILWGFFLKMVIADRIGIVADKVFNTYFVYGSAELAFASFCYTIQIYCDFAGYSAIAVGSASLFGFDLIQNFDCPYFSMSTKEFWRRWHISLSTWFRDYVYIPLGGSRCSKWRKRMNTMIVMLVSGIWHGVGWNFIAWGLVHGAYQVAEDTFTPVIDKIENRLHARRDTISYKLGKMIITFILVDLAWIFFRAGSIRIAVDYIRRMLLFHNPWVLFDGSLLELGLDKIDMNVLVFSMMILIIVDSIQYKWKIRIDRMLEEQCLWFRWGIIILLFTMVWVCGEYGVTFSSSQFIYQSF